MLIEIPASELLTLPATMAQQARGLAVRVRKSYIRIDDGVFKALIESYRPSLSEKIRNLVRDVCNADLKALRIQRELVDARIRACNDCRYLDKENATCTHNSCGCKVAFKSLFAFTTCPVGKWKQVVDNTPTLSDNPQPHDAEVSAP